MIRFLQRQRAKKGFTIIELIVVIAIIAVLMAVVLPFLNNENSRKKEANSAAKDFYSGVQMVMSKYSFFDGDLSVTYTNNKDLGIVRHYAMMGGNYPYDNGAGITDHTYPTATSLYIMIEAKNDIVQTIGAVSRAQSKSSSDPGFIELLERGSADRSTEFGRLFTGEIDDWIKFQDGFYYARVDFVPPLNPDGTLNKTEVNAETVKVVWTAYTRTELPSAAGANATDYTNKNLYFGNYNKLNNGTVCGVCAPVNSVGVKVGDKGTVLN